MSLSVCQAERALAAAPRGGEQWWEHREAEKARNDARRQLIQVQVSNFGVDGPVCQVLHPTQDYLPHPRRKASLGRRNQLVPTRRSSPWEPPPAHKFTLDSCAGGGSHGLALLALMCIDWLNVVWTPFEWSGHVGLVPEQACYKVSTDATADHRGRFWCQNCWSQWTSSEKPAQRLELDRRPSPSDIAAIEDSKRQCTKLPPEVSFHEKPTLLARRSWRLLLFQGIPCTRPPTMCTYPLNASPTSTRE